MLSERIKKRLQEEHAKMFPKAHAPAVPVLKSNVPDVVYILNLEKHHDRLEKTVTQLEKAGVPNVRPFKAVYGDDVEIKSHATGQTFRGLDIKNQYSRLEYGTIYEVNCQPETANPEKFNIMGSYTNLDGKDRHISSGELGIWCSYRLMWRDAQRNNYDKIIIFEDDIIIDTNNFYNNYVSFINDTPEDFDVSYLGFESHSRVFPISDNKAVGIFEPQGQWWSTYAIMYSKKVINQFLDFDHYKYAIDMFIYALSDKDGHASLVEVPNNFSPLNVYAANPKIVQVEYENSIITSMGRKASGELKSQDLHFPKIFHRIWWNWDKDKVGMPERYVELDNQLKKLHPDWVFQEWNYEQVVSFIQENYPEFVSTFLSYDIPTKQHDAARYLILKHFGGVFAQHSLYFQKNLDDLLSGYDAIFSRESKSSNDVSKNVCNNGFFASTKNHPIWNNIVDDLKKSSDINKVVSATGPLFMTKIINDFIDNHQSSSTELKILNSYHIFPFDWTEKDNPEIKDKCIENYEQCFDLFPDSHGFSSWTASWWKYYE